MRTPVPHVSLADLSAAGLRLRPVEAVTIVRELIRRASRAELPGIPSAHVIRLTGDGEILIEGPVAAGASVDRAARLLEATLPGFDAPPELRVPGALRLVLARALGTLDLPPYATLDEFAGALTRFASPDTPAAVRDLVGTWSAAVGAADGETGAGVSGSARIDPELTISDIRRARRSTGLTLIDISERSRIPVSLLRELEWGYYRNWPSGHYGRTQLVRYARAAGLDGELVVRTILPDIEASRGAGETVEGPVDGTVVDEVAPAGLVKIEGRLPAVRPLRSHRRRWAAALAIPALVAIGFAPALLNTGPAGDASGHAVTPTAPVAATAPASKPAVPRGANPREVNRAEGTRGGASPVARPAALRGDAGFSPAFATVGSAMFYHAEEGDGAAIMRADTDDTGAVLRVTSIVNDEANNFHARPSPDGRYIAFDSDRDGARAVYVADADGRNVRRVTGEGFAAVPSWSPDGSTLAFVRAEADNPKVWNLWTVHLETGVTRRLTSHSVGQPWGASWFPDGRRVAYSHENRLIVRSLTDGRERVYRAPEKNGWVRTPAVSPDGTRIIFQVHRDGVWLLDLRDGSMRKVLSDPTAEEFTWSPGGRRVAYHSRKTGKWGVWIMTAG